MGDTYVICIYNLQFTIYKLSLPTSKNHGWYICYMLLQFTNYFCQFKKNMDDTYAFTIYNLQFTIYKLLLPTQKNIDDTKAFTIYNLQNKKIIAVYTNAFSIIC